MKDIDIERIKNDIILWDDLKLFNAHNINLSDYIPEVQEIIKNEYIKRSTNPDWFNSIVENDNYIDNKNNSQNINKKQVLYFAYFVLVIITSFIANFIRPIMKNNYDIGLIVLLLSLILFFIFINILKRKYKSISLPISLLLLTITLCLIIFISIFFGFGSLNDISEMLSDSFEMIIEIF